MTFVFTLEEWPSVGGTPLKKVLWPCFFLSIPILASIGCAWLIIQTNLPVENTEIGIKFDICLEICNAQGVDI